MAPVEVKPGHCHICGNGPFERVDLHIRFKHKGYKVGAKTGAAPPKPAKPGAQAPDPSNGVAPADFSDLVDPGPVADTNRLAPMLDRSKHYQAGAVLTFEMSTNILSQIFGDEWQPQSEQEKAFVVSALQKYYESIEMPDLPPGYVLCFVCLAYAAPRLAAPKTKNKLALAWYWVKSKFSRRKYPAAAQAKQPAPAIPAQQP